MNERTHARLLDAQQLLTSGQLAQARAHLLDSWQQDPGDLDVLALLERCLDERADDRALLVRLLLEAAGGSHGGPTSEPQLWALNRALGLLEQLEQQHCREVAPLLARAVQKPQLRAALVAQRPTAGSIAAGSLRRLGFAPLAVSLLEALTGRDDSTPSPGHEPPAGIDATRRAHDLAELGSLYLVLERLDDAQAAYGEAIAASHGDPQILDRAKAQLAGPDKSTVLAGALERAASTETSGSVAAGLWRELALWAEQQLDDVELAARAWERRWQLEPDAEATDRVKRSCALRGDWDRYRELLERQLQLAIDFETTVAALRELAVFQRDVVEDETAVRNTLSAILRLAPHDHETLEALIELDLAASPDHRDRGAAARLTSRMRTLIAVCPVPEASERMRRSLIGLRRSLGDSPAQLLVELQRLDPRDPESRELLAELEAASASAASHRRSGAGAEGDTARPAEKEAERLAIRAEALATDGRPDRARHATRLLLRAGQLADHEKDAAGAEAYLVRATRVCPAEADEEQLLLQSALREAGMHEQLATQLSRQLATHRSPLQRVQLLRTLARLQADQLDHPQRAIATLQELLELDPGDEGATRDMERLAARCEDHATLARLLERRLERAEGPQRMLVLERLGAIYRDQLDDGAGALRTFHELLHSAPTHRDALGYCRRHAERLGDHRTVVGLLSRAAEATSDRQQRAELHQTIASIAEHELDDRELAIAQLRQLVDLVPSDSAAREQLKRLLRRARRWRELEAVLRSEIVRAPSEPQKVSIYLQLAELARSVLDEPAKAGGYLRNAAQLAPDQPQVLDQLEELYEHLGQWRELKAVLQHRAALASSPADKLELLRRTAALLAERLGGDQEALQTCRQALELQPADPATTRLMGEILSRAEAYDELADLLRQQIALETDRQRLEQLHLELAGVLRDRLDDADGAADQLRCALRLDPAGGGALGALRQLYAEDERWSDLAALLLERAQSEEIGLTERANVLCEVGRIYDEQLAERASARDAYERALELSPTCRPAARALRFLAVADDRHTQAVSAAQRELELLEHPADRARLLAHIAQLQNDHLQRPDLAIRSLEQALEQDPTNSRAAQLLADSYFAAGNWQRAAQLLQRLLDSDVELDDLHEYYYRLGFATERTGDEDQAFSYYVKAFGREPLHLPTLERLVELCYVRNQWENTMRIAEAIISTYGEGKSREQIADLHVRKGLCELHIAQQAVAVQRLRAIALGGAPSAAPHHGWEDVAQSWAATPLEPHLVAQIDVDAVTRVIRSMEPALSRVADHPEALQVVAALTLARGDYQRSLKYLERAIGSPRTDSDQRARLLVTAGDVHAMRLSQPRQAESYYRRALQLTPRSRTIRRRLDRLEASRRRAP